MRCEQQDPDGWIPWCGVEFDPATQWPVCPHPVIRASRCPDADSHHTAAWGHGWRPPHYLAAAQSPEALAHRVALALGTPLELVRGGGKAPRDAEARWLVAAVVRRLCGASYPALGVILGRDHTTIMHGCRQVSRSERLTRQVDDLVRQVA